VVAYIAAESNDESIAEFSIVSDRRHDRAPPMAAYSLAGRGACLPERHPNVIGQNTQKCEPIKMQNPQRPTALLLRASVVGRPLRGMREFHNELLASK
jgi:hypothetical protein